MNCRYESQGSGLYRCAACGHRTTIDRATPPKRNCPGESREEEATPAGTWLRRAGSYVSAVTRWQSAGRPVRDEEEVARIYATVCQPCEHFRGDTCGKCGCRIAASGAALVNKIRMATENCPIGKW